MQRNRQLDDAEPGADVPTGAGAGIDELFANLGGERAELVARERFQVSRRFKPGEDRHACLLNASLNLVAPRQSHGIATTGGTRKGQELYQGFSRIYTDNSRAGKLHARGSSQKSLLNPMHKRSQSVFICENPW
jgi:hypothetical protein